MKSALILATCLLVGALFWSSDANASAASAAIEGGTRRVADFLTTLPSQLGWKTVVGAAVVLLVLDRLRSRNSGRFEH